MTQTSQSGDNVDVVTDDEEDVRGFVDLRERQRKLPVLVDAKNDVTYKGPRPGDSLTLTARRTYSYSDPRPNLPASSDVTPKSFTDLPDPAGAVWLLLADLSFIDTSQPPNPQGSTPERRLPSCVPVVHVEASRRSLSRFQL